MGWAKAGSNVENKAFFNTSIRVAITSVFHKAAERFATYRGVCAAAVRASSSVEGLPSTVPIAKVPTTVARGRIGACQQELRQAA